CRACTLVFLRRPHLRRAHTRGRDRVRTGRHRNVSSVESWRNAHDHLPRVVWLRPSRGLRNVAGDSGGAVPLLPRVCPVQSPSPRLVAPLSLDRLSLARPSDRSSLEGDSLDNARLSTFWGMSGMIFATTCSLVHSIT